MLAPAHASATRPASAPLPHALGLGTALLLYSCCTPHHPSAAQDLEGRPEEVKASASGRHETLVFKQTVANFEPLYKRLKQRQIDPVMREGLWMMVESMLARNYLAALDVYLRWGLGWGVVCMVSVLLCTAPGPAGLVPRVGGAGLGCVYCRAGALWERWSHAGSWVCYCMCAGVCHYCMCAGVCHYCMCAGVCHYCM